MKITKKEVKTIISIQIDTADVMKAFEQAEADYKRLGHESYECINKEAFKSVLEKEDLLMKDLRSYTENTIKHVWGNKEDSETLRYIIKFLGFDGIENFGIYKQNCDARCMTVYMEGENL